MLRSIFGLCLVFLAAADPISRRTSQAPRAEVGRLGRVPLVVVDRTGETLLGPAHMHLLVYSDGHAAYVSRSGEPLDDYNLDLQLTPAVVQSFHARLREAGALDLRSQATRATDVPLTTVTWLEADPRGRANTFSYWIGSETYAPIAEELETFVKSLRTGREVPPDEGGGD
jgi:hypothetical protein